MNSDFYNLVKNSTAHTKSRTDNGNYVIDNPQFLEPLINMSFDIKNKTHIRACNILEKVVDLQIDACVPYHNLIFNNLQLLQNDCAIRPIARLVMNLVLHGAKSSNYLTNNQLEKITEACFDWLISDIRMASKVYAMYTLAEIGKKQQWIFLELQQILSKDAAKQTVGYKAAAIGVLKKIAKN